MPILNLFMVKNTSSKFLDLDYVLVAVDIRIFVKPSDKAYDEFTRLETPPSYMLSKPANQLGVQFVMYALTARLISPMLGRPICLSEHKWRP